MQRIGYVVRGTSEAAVIEVEILFVGERHAVFKIKNNKTGNLDEGCASFAPGSQDPLLSHFFLAYEDAEKRATAVRKQYGEKE